MLWTIGAAVSAAFLLYGGWLVLVQLISSVEEPLAEPAPLARPE